MKARVLLTALSAWLGLEALCFLFFIARHDGFTTPKTLLARGKTELGGKTSSECAWDGSNLAHPYLSFVKNPAMCHPPWPVHSGFHNQRPFPVSNDPATYDILVLGGSVAEILANWRATGTAPADRSLEERLNDRFTGPRGEPIRIYNAALGSGGWPQQLIATSIFQRLVDATLVLDGFNEAAALGDGRKVLGVPQFHIFNGLHPATEDGRLLRWASLARSLRDWLVDSPWGNSAILFGLYRITYARAYDYSLAGRSVTQAWDFGSQYVWPPSTSRDTADEGNARLYGIAARQLHQFTVAGGLASAHFMQPIAALDKPLTPHERDLSHGEVGKNLYLAMRREFRSALAEGALQGADLTGMFQGVAQEIYADYVHFKVDLATGKSAGYDALVEAMLPHLARTYGLRPRRPRSP